VNTMATPKRSAAAMTSASFTEPPGWIRAVAPFLTASSRPSGNGFEVQIELPLKVPEIEGVSGGSGARP
jgi:hypothetical protein